MKTRKARNSSKTHPIPFNAVLENELDLIAAARAGDATEDGGSVYERARAMNLSALAFSGGGIRSAIFNLGFLQGLANRNVLHGFDYLSTVSGGGYIGGWFSALLKRRAGGTLAGEMAVRKLGETLLATQPVGEAAGTSGFHAPESQPVRFLRNYVNYLTPRLGLTGDTLSLISLTVRNVAVMQMLLLSLLVGGFASLLLVAGLDWYLPVRAMPYLGELLALLNQLAGVDFDAPGRWLLVVAIGMLLLAAMVAIWLQMNLQWKRLPCLSPNGHVVLLVLLPALSSGILMGIAMKLGLDGIEPIQSGSWIWLVMLGYGVVWSGTVLRNRLRVRAIAGLLGGSATLGLSIHLLLESMNGKLYGAPFGHVVIFAPIVALLLQSLVLTVHMALAGAAISEQNREWWARAGGQAMLIVLIWFLAFGFLFYAPPLIWFGMEWSVAGGGLWAALSWVGARFAQGMETGGKGGTLWKEIASNFAPWVFLVGLISLVAWAFASLLPGVKFTGQTLSATVSSYHDSLAVLQVALLVKIAVVAGILFLLLVLLVDLNLFSAHSFYRNRLARTFVGASRARRTPDHFTGFDSADDMPLSDLAGQRPFHLLNATLNLTGGEELAWQTRRGASFVFTPCHSGYFSRTATGRLIGGYRPTAEYGAGLSLATVMATCGAAASPNMGFHTSTSVAALLTAFNLRLARWCPNPAKKQWRRASPGFSAAPFFAELFGSANYRNAWLNLSDGGHFDNLGLYELVRRRAALIVVTDVGADGKYQFDDLAMLVRKLAVDFGVDLQISEVDLDEIRPPCSEPGADPEHSSCFSKKHWAFGRIVYPDGSKPGCLIYVKSSLTVDAPVDIRQYRDAHPAFPHESTADQCFDEDQLEAYRHLGQIIAEQLLDDLLEKRDPDLPAHELVGFLSQQIRERCEKASSSTTPTQGDKP